MDDYRFSAIERRLEQLEKRINGYNLGALIQQVIDARGDIEEVKGSLKANNRLLWALLIGLLFAVATLATTALTSGIGG